MPARRSAPMIASAVGRPLAGRDSWDGTDRGNRLAVAGPAARMPLPVSVPSNRRSHSVSDGPRSGMHRHREGPPRTCRRCSVHRWRRRPLGTAGPEGPRARPHRSMLSWNPASDRKRATCLAPPASGGIHHNASATSCTVPPSQRRPRTSRFQRSPMSARVARAHVARRDARPRPNVATRARSWHSSGNARCSAPVPGARRRPAPCSVRARRPSRSAPPCSPIALSAAGMLG